MPQQVRGFEIQMGEYGAETQVGIKPPMPDDKLHHILEGLSDREKPFRVTISRPGGGPDKAYTLLEFLHPHFGEHRHTYALGVVEALKNALSNNGSSVSVNEGIKSLHSDQRLFE